MVNDFLVRLILKIRGEFLLGFVLVFYFGLPVINIIRVFFSYKMNLILIFFLFLTVGLLTVSFFVYKNWYCNCVIFLFHSFFTQRRQFFSLGAYLIKEWPFVFGCFLVVSLVSVLFWRPNPHILWMHSLDCFCVCFRNIFIVPYLGWSLLVTTNLRKKFILEQQTNQEVVLPLFSNTNLSENFGFYYNFVTWAESIVNLKPSETSLKKTSAVSVPGFCLSYFNSLYQKLASLMFDKFQENENAVRCHISKTLDLCFTKEERDDNLSVALKEMSHVANIIQKKSNLLSMQMEKEMNSSFLGFHFWLHEKKFHEIFKKSNDLLLDSQMVQYCSQDQGKTKIHQNIFAILVEKHGSPVQVASFFEPKCQFLEIFQTLFW